jgi:hypothetical protein
MPMFHTNDLLASMLWGAIGGGFCLYGKKQAATVPLAGGLLMVAGSYFIPSAWELSLASIALLGGMVWLMRAGY